MEYRSLSKWSWFIQNLRVCGSPLPLGASPEHDTQVLSSLSLPCALTHGSQFELPDFVACENLMQPGH